MELVARPIGPLRSPSLIACIEQGFQCGGPFMLGAGQRPRKQMRRTRRAGVASGELKFHQLPAPCAEQGPPDVLCAAERANASCRAPILAVVHLAPGPRYAVHRQINGFAGLETEDALGDVRAVVHVFNPNHEIRDGCGRHCSLVCGQGGEAIAPKYPRVPPFVKPARTAQAPPAALQPGVRAGCAVSYRRPRQPHDGCGLASCRNSRRGC